MPRNFYGVMMMHLRYQFQIRSYHVEYTASHQNCEVKRHWAYLVLRWGTTWEQYGAVSFWFFLLFFEWFIVILTQANDSVFDCASNAFEVDQVKNHINRVITIFQHHFASFCIFCIFLQLNILNISLNIHFQRISRIPLESVPLSL